ncbi:hypothetical protein LTR56_012696 [Elasticomyces elasticus]|nr:hypothetical protein LTR22_022670 [Elasticomyces elasticus]KAK3638973.1 hypothetical protein LTR56_012696 [Elasticomyces elasticus]KAK4918773.1 hypothetical protein LTR49_013560 [Elasticomyces elasticus]KAK5754398.1 hypothetical protein LTS12_015467 [Elasticomyces elasticus]
MSTSETLHCTKLIRSASPSLNAREETLRAGVGDLLRRAELDPEEAESQYVDKLAEKEDQESLEIQAESQEEREKIAKIEQRARDEIKPLKDAAESMKVRVAELETTVSDTRKLLLFWEEDLEEAKDTINDGVIYAAKHELARDSPNKAITHYHQQAENAIHIWPGVQ